MSQGSEEGEFDIFCGIALHFRWLVTIKGQKVPDRGYDCVFRAMAQVSISQPGEAILRDFAPCGRYRASRDSRTIVNDMGQLHFGQISPAEVDNRL